MNKKLRNGLLIFAGIAIVGTVCYFGFRDNSTEKPVTAEQKKNRKIVFTR